MAWLGALVAVVGGAALLVALRRAYREERTAMEPALLVAAVPLMMFSVAVLDRPRFIGWMQEDWPAEWATVAAFAAAALVALARAASSDLRPIVRLGWLCCAAAWTFVAGEEISWGQRLIGFATPEAWLAHNVQLEANLHNSLPPLAVGGVVIDSAFLAGVLALGLGAVGPAGLTQLAKRWPSAADLLPLVARGPLRPALVLVAGLQWADVADFASEVTELTLGLAALLIAMDARRWRPGRATLLVVLTLLAGALMSAGLRPVDDDPAKVDDAKQELLLLAGDLRQDIEQLLSAVASLRHRTFHARLQWTLRVLEVELSDDGRFARDAADAATAKRRRYFLDPWGTPYWLYVDFSRRQVLVYSTGPDRRRDTDLLEHARPSGDDLGVAIRWPEGGLELRLEQPTEAPVREQFEGP